MAFYAFKIFCDNIWKRTNQTTPLPRDRLKDLAQMVLRRNKEKDRMINFEVDQNPRGPHISLMIDTDRKTKYDMILQEKTINSFKRVYANVAVSLDGMMNFKDNYKDSITVSVTAHEIQEIRARLGLESQDFNAHITLLKRAKKRFNKRS